MESHTLIWPLKLGYGTPTLWCVPSSWGDVAYVTLHWALCRLLRHRFRNKGVGGAWRHEGGAWTWKPEPGKPLSTIPEPMGAVDLTQAKAFYGPARCLDAGVPLRTLLPPLGGKAVGEAAALEAQIGVPPAVEGRTITRPIKPLGQAAPATSSTMAPTGAPQGAPPSAAAHVRTALGAMGTVAREPDFEVFAFRIRS